MRGFAISSAVDGVPITAEIATALLQNLRRLERLWVRQLTDPQEANARVCAVMGAVFGEALFLPR